MQLVYDDYELDDTRIESLKILQLQFIDSLRNDIEKYSNDPLCTDQGIHITDTEIQSKSDLWFQMRCIRVTASSFKVKNFNQSLKIRHV